jgi:phosphopantothenoylcysteine decarboxylase/phosphopantothenate--cysteine ligase
MAPAMHTEMWLHPATRANVALLRERGVVVLEPDSGRLTGADTGPGRLPEPEAIATAALLLLPGLSGLPGVAPRASGNVPTGDLGGRRVVVSAGGTREALDPVRFLGNRSSGRQGVALAAAAAARGASVTLVAAHLEVPEPGGVELVRVTSALQLRDAVLAAAADADVVVMAAAVADFRPAEVADHNNNNAAADDGAPTITLVRNPDVLAELGRRRRPGQVLVGFAAETGDESGGVLEHARRKLAAKGCDLLVLNDVSAGRVFGRPDTEVVLLHAGGEVTPLPPGSKAAVAEAIWDATAAILGNYAEVQPRPD